MAEMPGCPTSRFRDVGFSVGMRSHKLVTPERSEDLAFPGRTMPSSLGPASLQHPNLQHVRRWDRIQRQIDRPAALPIDLIADNLSQDVRSGARPTIHAEHVGIA